MACESRQNLNLNKNALYLWKVISTKINKVGKKWLDGVTETNSHFDDFYIFFSYNFFSLFEHNDDMWLFLDLEFVLISRVKNVVCVN